MPARLGSRLDGVVSAFDDDRGYGTVTSDNGVERFFHCTQIADGSRTITVGQRVTFDVVAGHLGRWEGADLRPSEPHPTEGS